MHTWHFSQRQHTKSTPKSAFAIIFNLGSTEEEPVSQAEGTFVLEHRFILAGEPMKRLQMPTTETHHARGKQEGGGGERQFTRGMHDRAHNKGETIGPVSKQRRNTAHLTACSCREMESFGLAGIPRLCWTRERCRHLTGSG